MFFLGNQQGRLKPTSRYGMRPIQKPDLVLVAIGLIGVGGFLLVLINIVGQGSPICMTFRYISARGFRLPSFG